jgi:hypothetical protein
MSKESKGKCKYCHLTGHLIDKCPTIICKHCKAIGHPNWLCKNNPNAENVKSNPLSPNLRNKKSIYAFDSTHSLSKSQNFDSTHSLSKSQNFDSTHSLSKSENNMSDSFITSEVTLEKNNSFKSSLLVTKDENNNDVKNVYLGFKEDFKQKVIETNKVETPIINLQYYQKMVHSKWGDLIETF